MIFDPTHSVINISSVTQTFSSYTPYSTKMKLICTICLIVIAVDGHLLPNVGLIKTQEKRAVDDLVKGLSGTLADVTQVLAEVFERVSQCMEVAGISEQDINIMTDEDKGSDPRFQNFTICVDT